MVTCCGGGHVDGVEGGCTSPAINLERGGQTEGRQASGRTTAIAKCKPGAASHSPSRRGFLQVRRSYIGPSSSDARVSTKTRPSSKAHPGRCLLPRLDANLPQRRRRPRHLRPPPPPYIFITLYNNKRPLADAAALIFFFSHRASWFFRDDTHGGGAFPSRQTPSYTSRHTQQHQQHNNNHILHSNEHDRGVYFLISAFSPSVYTGKGGRRNQWWWWWCRLPCHSLHTFFHLLS